MSFVSCWLFFARREIAARSDQITAAFKIVEQPQLVAAHGLQAELDALAAVHCPADRRRYHAALYDAFGGALLLRMLLTRPDCAGATIPWLLQMSTLDPEKRGALQQGDLF